MECDLLARLSTSELAQNGQDNPMVEIKQYCKVVNDCRTPYLQAGRKRSTEAVVFVHGNPGSGQDWADLASRVGVFARVIAPDMPGFGQAEKPENFDYTVPGYAAHLDALLEDLGVERAHLVLHDFGGPWGLAWAAMNRDRLASLTLINSGLMLGYRWHFAARIWRLPLVGEAFQRLTTKPLFEALVNFRAVRRLPEAFVQRMYQDYDQGTRRAVLRLYRATSDLDGMARHMIDALSGLDIPVLVLWGARDAFVPKRYAGVQQEVFPQAQVHLLPDSGHFPFADDPEGVAEKLLPFLRDAAALPASPKNLP